METENDLWFECMRCFVALQNQYWIIKIILIRKLEEVCFGTQGLYNGRCSIRFVYHSIKSAWIKSKDQLSHHLQNQTLMLILMCLSMSCEYLQHSNVFPSHCEHTSIHCTSSHYGLGNRRAYQSMPLSRLILYDGEHQPRRSQAARRFEATRWYL